MYYPYLRARQFELIAIREPESIQAESYLVNLDEMVHDGDVPASTRLEAIKSVVKWGRLEPKEDKGQDSGGNTINLQINFT